MSFATLGLLTASCLLCLTAYSFFRLFQKLSLQKFQTYSAAFLALGMAFLIWGWATSTGSQNSLILSIIAGNIFFAAGSLFCLNILTLNQKKRMTILLLSVILFIAYLAIRVLLLPINPYIENSGILIFNTPQFASLAIFLTVLFIWLPTSTIVARTVSEKIKLKEIEFGLMAVYIMMSLSGFVLIATRSMMTLTMAFIMFTISFVLVLYVNEFTTRLTNKL